MNNSWYDKKFTVIALLFIFFPVGIYAMWKNKHFSIKTKWIVSVSICSFVLFANITNNKQSQPTTTNREVKQDYTQNSNPKDLQLPNHSIFKDKSYEKGGKAQVEYHILVGKDNLSKKSLSILLNQLYEEATHKTDWKYHDAPTVILIRAYTSKQHYVSGNMIGEVVKAPVSGPQPNFRFNDDQLQNLNKLPEVKWGMTEEQRKYVYALLGQTHIRAIQEADKKFPNFGHQHDAMVETLMKRYKEEILREYELTEEKNSQLYLEGMQKNWPEFHRRN